LIEFAEPAQSSRRDLLRGGQVAKDVGEIAAKLAIGVVVMLPTADAVHIAMRAIRERF
jgi:hypothetical protein